MMKPIIIASVTAALLSIVFVEMAQAEPCPPTVVVEGRSAIARELALELTLSGLEQHSAPECPLVRVHVERKEHGEIVLALSDQYGRSAQRSVGSTTSAATVVTSWAKQVPMTESTWNTTTAVGVATTKLTPPSAIATVESSQGPPVGYGGISLLFESALDTHDQRWLGAGIAGCVQLGQVCVGALARYGDSDKRSIGSLSDRRKMPIILTGGRGFDVLATIQRPLRLGPIVLSPALLAGLGLVEFKWVYDVLTTYTSSLKGVRFGTRLGARWHIGRGFSLELGVSVEALPGNYLRYDTETRLPPEQVFDYNMQVRGGIGIRHGN